MGLLGGAAAFANVATHAGANDVLPDALAALAARNHVIQAELRSRMFPAAVLALVVVAGEDVPAVEFHRLLRQLIVAHQPDHPRHLDFAVHGSHPVVVFLPEVAGAGFADFPPAG